MQKKKKAAAKKRTASIVSTVSTPIEKVSAQAEKLMEKISNRAEDAAASTGRQACKLVLSVIDFQKTTFDNTFKIISQLQEQSEKMVGSMVTESSWVPSEGKGVVKEWIKMLQSGRNEFRKTVDKSFDLLTDYFERVQKSGALEAGAAKKSAKKAAPKKAAAKKAAAKKAPAKKAPAKKAAPKRKAAAKAGSAN